MDEYFTSAKKEGGEIILTILKTDSEFKDYPLFGSCIYVNFGLEFAPTQKMKDYLFAHYPNMTLKEIEELYGEIAATIWKEYGMIALREIHIDGIFNF